MDLFSWITGSDPVDNSLTSRSSSRLYSSSHSGVYRRPGNQQAAKERKPCNPGIYSAYSGGNGKARGGCLAGMRGFEPIEEQVYTQRSFRGARSLSPQKVHRDHFLLRDTDQHDVHISPMRSREFRPATISSGTQQSGLYGRPSEAQRSFFNEGGGYPQQYQQPQASDSPVYDMHPKRLYQFQPSPIYYEESPQDPVNCTKDVSAVSTPATNVSTSPPKSDITPSTSDHSDVDDLAPRSIHSPTISDSHTPPSSAPGSPAVSQTLPDAGSESDPAENPQKDGEDPVLPLKKLPFASLDLKDSGIVKARTCVRNAQKLNKSLTGECRCLEDEMSDLTKDLEALRAQLKNRRV